MLLPNSVQLECLWHVLGCSRSGLCGRMRTTSVTPACPHTCAHGGCVRFYFVSDPTLLEILSLGSDPPSVVPHFQSGLFDSLTNVTFDKVDKTRMLEMFSQQGEKVRVRRITAMQGYTNARSTAVQKSMGRQASTSLMVGCFLAQLA